ncbi:MAG: glycosyltransferase family 39 protein [Oscillospiraceae bacterium]|jgi:dolichyl-phosphate-mannose-protein mannosyltransferase
MGQWHVYLFPLLTIAALAVFFRYYVQSVKKSALVTVSGQAEERPKLRFPSKRFPMERKDALPLLLLVVVYAVTAFWGLGNTGATQRFCQFPSAGSSLELTLKQPTELGSLLYYCGLNTGNYTLEYTTDGVTWETAATLEQKYVDLFKWKTVDLTEEHLHQVIALRLTADSSGMEMGELALYDSAGNLLTQNNFTDLTDGAKCLMDEQDLVPETSTYMDSTYFDEIYHARTAYEHIRNVYPYEVSHPPLGKLILGLGIQMFGMTPFGWRFMGTLFGVLMLPILYVFFKNLFGKTPVALCGTALFAFDFMHLTQTRIATIDTYAVFFILLMYYFMYRFLTAPTDGPFRKTAVPLMLSGLFFGIGIASKWTVIYGGAGLAVLLLVSLILRYRDAKEQDLAQTPEEASSLEGASHLARRSYWKWLGLTFLVCVGFFLVVPLVIYCLSYLPYAAAKGEPLSWKLIWDNQVFMFTYHKGVTQMHPYSSKWWQWILDIRPILYYLENNVGNGLKSAFGAFSNPVVCWGGLISLVLLVWRFVKTKAGIALFILIAYLSQLVFWIPIARPTFAYHYFPCILFLTFAITYLFNEIWEAKQGRYQMAVYGFTGGAVFLYAVFYPILTGVAVPAFYGTNFLKWMPSWPF